MKTVSTAQQKKSEFQGSLTSYPHAWDVGDQVVFGPGNAFAREGDRGEILDRSPDLIEVQIPTGGVIALTPDEAQRILRLAKTATLQGGPGAWTITPISFNSFRQVVGGKEGLVLLGAGGDLNKWIDGIVGMWVEEGLVPQAAPDLIFDAGYVLTTSGGRTDLALVFSDNSGLNIGKLAMWRLQFGDASWISDYVVNYADQHLS